MIDVQKFSLAAATWLRDHANSDHAELKIIVREGRHVRFEMHEATDQESEVDEDTSAELLALLHGEGGK